MPPPAADSQSRVLFRSPQGAASVHLDALRGIAAIGVCLSHLRDLFFRDYPRVPHHSLLLALGYLATGLGHQWVTVFFVLSGYLVGGSVLRAQATGRWTWGDYLFNRMTRLYIVLMPALVLGGIVDAAGLHFFGLKGIYGGGAGSHTITYAVKDHLSFATLLGNYAFLQTILVPTLGSNGPLWSLANELWYYIAFPALLFTVLPHVKLPYRIVHFVLLIAVISLMALGPGIALLGLVWLMGVAIHYLPRIPAKGALARRLIVAGATVIFAATLAWSKHTRVEATDYILGIAVTLLIYALLECSRKPMPKAYTTIAQRAAHSSYTLYLTHLPMLVLVAAFFEWKYNIHRWVPDGRYLLFGVGIFLAAMLYAQAVWFVFEKRTDSLRAWLKPVLLQRGLRSGAPSPGR